VRLYLSSFRLGDHPEYFVSLLRTTAPGVVVANAVDGAPEEARASMVAAEIMALTDLGLEARELDLRDHVGRPDAVRAALAEVGFVWVRGGNTFVLREAMRRARLEGVLREALAKDALVYAGYSAGACVLAPSLRGLERCDPVAEVEQLSATPATFDGLGVLDHAIVPHLATPSHPECAVLTGVAERYDAEGIAYLGLRDGQALVVDGKHRCVV